MRGCYESAGINRHRVGDERMAPSHVRAAARLHVKR